MTISGSGSRPQSLSDKIASPDYKMACAATTDMASKLDVTNDNVESSLKSLKDTI